MFITDTRWRPLREILEKEWRQKGFDSLDSFLNCTHEWTEWHPLYTKKYGIYLHFNDPIDELAFILKHGASDEKVSVD